MCWLYLVFPVQYYLLVLPDQMTPQVSQLSICHLPLGLSSCLTTCLVKSVSLESRDRVFIVCQWYKLNSNQLNQKKEYVLAQLTRKSRSTTSDQHNIQSLHYVVLNVFLSSFLYLWDRQPSAKLDSYLPALVTTVEGTNLSWWPLKKKKSHSRFWLFLIQLCWHTESTEGRRTMYFNWLVWLQCPSTSLLVGKGMWKGMHKCYQWVLGKKYLWTLGIWRWS